MEPSRIITVFGSYAPTPGSAEYEQAYQAGLYLGRAGFSIANGGYAGTMEASAKGAQKAGAKTIGVTCTAFKRSQPNAYIDQEVQTACLRDRLEKLIELGTGYVVLPGGTGTLTELAYTWELLNKGFLDDRPLVILGDFWLPVVDIVQRATPRSRLLVKRAHSPEELPRFFKKPSQDPLSL